MKSSRLLLYSGPNVFFSGHSVCDASNIYLLLSSTLELSSPFIKESKGQDFIMYFLCRLTKICKVFAFH